MSATVLAFPKTTDDEISASRIYIVPNGYSSRGPRYTVHLDDPDGEIIVTDTLTPLYDSARALLARGITGQMEMWDSQRPYARMGGDIAALAKLRTEESETISPRVLRWMPFAGDRGPTKTAASPSRLPKCPKTEAVAGEQTQQRGAESPEENFQAINEARHTLRQAGGLLP